MKTIQTKPAVTLGFYKGPNGHTPDSRYGAEMYINIGSGVMQRVVNIGKLSEITEEQAKELVKQVKQEDGTFYIAYGTFNVCKKAIESLKYAALSLGIPELEFNNYLVVKL